MRHEKKPMGTMDRILCITACMLFLFTAVMIVLFALFREIPDTLCTCVFGVLGGECGVMGWIQTTKTRHTERKWEIQDRQEQKHNDKTELEELEDV